MTLLVTTSPQPGGTYVGQDSRAPSTPFAATMDDAKRNWFKDFLKGAETQLAEGLGYQPIPVSDAQTPNQNSVPANPLGALTRNPLVLYGAIAVVAILLLKRK